MSVKIIESVKAEFQLDVKTVSPLLQIEPSDSKNKDRLTKASIVVTKKRKYVAEDGKLVDVPFFSANGYRGTLRRNLTSAIFGSIEETDLKKFSVDSIHLYASGGGSSNDGMKNMNYADQVSFRQTNPYLSCFGAGLSDLDGKLAVTDLTPVNKELRLIDYQYGVRFDETQRGSILRPLLDEDSIKEYNDFIDKLRTATKSLVKLEDELKKLKDAYDKDKSDELAEQISDLEQKIAVEKEEKGMSYQQVYKAEFIIPGTQMSGSVSTRGGHKLNELERGMILFGLIQTSQQSIGSYARIGWGVNEWEVKDGDGNTLFKTVPNSKYSLAKETTITDLGKSILKPFETWLESINRDAIFLMK